MTKCDMYFAYGANLASAVMARRKIEHGAVVRGVVRGWRLVFADVGMPYVEPAFATLEQDPNAEVHGVVYTLDRSNWAMLDAYEGRDNERISVDVALQSGEIVVARTYHSKVCEPGLLPSRRYLALVVQGATEWGLPGEWVAGLAAHPTAYVPVISEIIGVGVGLFDSLNRHTGFFDRFFHATSKRLD